MPKRINDTGLRRQRILKSARKVFLEKGFHGATIDGKRASRVCFPVFFQLSVFLLLPSCGHLPFLIIHAPLCGAPP